MDTLTTTVEAIFDRSINGVNSRDLEADLANQHPDVEFVLPGGGVTLHGRAEIRVPHTHVRVPPSCSRLEHPKEAA